MVGGGREEGLGCRGGGGGRWRGGWGGGGIQGGFFGRGMHGWSLFDCVLNILGGSDEALVRVECLLAEPVGFFQFTRRHAFGSGWRLV